MINLIKFSKLNQTYQESQSDNEKPHTQINAHITYMLLKHKIQNMVL